MNGLQDYDQLNSVRFDKQYRKYEYSKYILELPQWSGHEVGEERSVAAPKLSPLGCQLQPN